MPGALVAKGMVTARRALVVLCLLVLPLVGAVAPGGAAPPPRPVCDACGDSFAATAEAHGVDLAVERSTARVVVHENGSATWTVRNRLADPADAERLRANATLRAAIGDRAMWDTEFIGASVSAAGVVTLRYREPGFAEPAAGGVLRSGVFTEGYGYRNLDGLGADRLTVVAPDGMRVGWAVPGASVAADGSEMTLTAFERGGFVTFVPRGSVAGPLWSLLSVGSLVAPVFAVNVLLTVALPAVLFGLLVAALGGALSWVDASRRLSERVRDRADVGLVAAGGLATALALAAGGVSLLGGSAAPVFGVGVALVAAGAALSRPAVREAVSYRTLLVGATLGALVAAGATLAAAVAFDGSGPTRSLLTTVPFLLALFALFPAGFALGRGRRRLAVGTAVAGFALSVLPLASPFAPSAWGVLFVPLFLSASAGAIALLGLPLLVVGAALGGGRPGGRPRAGPPGGRPQ